MTEEEVDAVVERIRARLAAKAPLPERGEVVTLPNGLRPEDIDLDAVRREAHERAEAGW